MKPTNRVVCATFRRLLTGCIVAASTILIAGCSAGGDSGGGTPSASAGTPGAEQAVGERLFLETRFAQSFKVFLDNGGNVNSANINDPVVDSVETTTPGQPISPGPFQGKSINYRSCHFVDDTLGTQGGGMRTYSDFARRSPVPARPDKKTHTPRNSPPLVGASLDRPGGPLFHFDAEFNSMEDLVAATFTGRNFGWLPGERAQAITHIARVVRGDNGTGDLAQQFDGLPSRILVTGTNASIPEEYRLPPEFRVFVGSASDQEIFDAVVKVVAAYVKGLRFSQTDDNGTPIRSPFDVFLELIGLPQQPAPNESPLDYSRRLRALVQGLANPQFVAANPNAANGQFQFHNQLFTFGAQELEGLKIFLAEPSQIPPTAAELAAGQIGNCLACHPAPNFTDLTFHNTGTTQNEYDAIHGNGSFMALAIPDLAARNANPNQYLPATEQHPGAQEPFRSIPSVANPALVDLGLWNIFANPDMPNPQVKIHAILCESHPAPCPADNVLPVDTVAAFKTPGLRDLGHSSPYMHNGQFDTLDAVIEFYRGVSSQARAGTLRNGDLVINRQLQGIGLTANDVAALVAFLQSLNEDYQ
jgi:hypothetical protein